MVCRRKCSTATSRFAIGLLIPMKEDIDIIHHRVYCCSNIMLAYRDNRANLRLSLPRITFKANSSTVLLHAGVITYTRSLELAL